MSVKQNKRPLVSKRGVSTKKADEAKTPIERLVALNESLQGLHYAHNEVRRIIPLMLDTIVEILSEAIAAAAKESDKKDDKSGGKSDNKSDSKQEQE